VVRYIGMDVHREFAQLAVVEDGLVRDEGRIGVTPEALRQWAAGLRADDQVALEATGKSDAIANLLGPLVGRVVVSNPSKTRAIAEAKVKTDKVDARILPQLLAADFLPPVWLPDERTPAPPQVSIRTNGFPSPPERPGPAPKRRARWPCARYARYGPSAWRCRFGSGATWASMVSGAVWWRPNVRRCAGIGAAGFQWRNCFPRQTSAQVSRKGAVLPRRSTGALHPDTAQEAPALFQA
jgi:hypothetical protein